MKEKELVTFLKEYHLTISTAESCTGGLVAAALINEAGVSEVYKEGFITYANEAKCRYLSVKEETLAKFGVVSGECVKEMAEGCAKQTGADVTITTSGVAGPDGGTKEKPVGLVYFGCYYQGALYETHKLFSGNRMQIRTAATEFAIGFVLDILQNT